MAAHVFDLRPAELVALTNRGAGLAFLLVGQTEPVDLRPRMQRDDIERMTVFPDLRPSRTVGDNAVGNSPDQTGHVLDRVFRRNDLREIVAVSALIPVFMSVAPGQFAPMFRQIGFFGLYLLVRGCSVVAYGFAPHADVGILGAHPIDETRIVVALPRPHAVLDVPVEQTQIRFIRLPLRTSRQQGQDEQTDGRGRFDCCFHCCSRFVQFAV